MKILYLHQYFVTPRMSGGTRSYEMARRLVAAGHEVHIITTNQDVTKAGPNTAGWSKEIIDGIHVHWLHVPYSNKMGFAARFNAFLQFAVKAGGKARSIGGDLVFATSTPLTITLPAVWAKWRLKVPMVFEVRDLWPELPIAMNFLSNPVLIAAARWLERLSYAQASHIIALSPGMAEGVLNCDTTGTPVDIIPNGSDISTFASSPEATERFRAAHPELGKGQIILYAGTLGAINGVSYLADLAFACRTLNPDLRFVIIGHGAEDQIIKDHAQKLGVLGQNFFMYPPLPKMELVDAFSAASLSTSLFIDLPEMWSNSANKFFDGLASATAVGINYKGWQHDLLAEHDFGLALDLDPSKAAPDVVAFLADPDRVSSCAQNALFLAQQKFDRNLLGAEFVAILNRYS